MSAEGRGRTVVCTRDIGSGPRLLMAAVFCWLLALPAAAHPAHPYGTAAFPAVGAGEGSTDRSNSRETQEAREEERVIAAYHAALVSSYCCCGQSGGTTGSGCCTGMACAPGSCGHASGALLMSLAVHIETAAKRAGSCLLGQHLAGFVPGPDDRPPRVSVARRR